MIRVRADDEPDRADELRERRRHGSMEDRLGAVEGQLSRLADQVGELARSVAPVLEHHAAEEREAEIRARVEERLREMGLVVPPRVEGGDSTTALTSPPVTAPAPPTPPAMRDSWARDVVLAAETTGGRRILGAVLAAWTVAWVGAAGVDLAHDVWAYVMSPELSVAVEVPAALPDMGESPQPAADTGPQIDTPAAPRPTL